MLRTLRGIGRAIRARPGAFAAVTLGALVLYVFLPPLVLSLARKPADYFTFNPWLRRLPEYLASDRVSLGRKLEFLPNLYLFQFSADSLVMGTEWAVEVDVSDVARFLVMSLLLGAYFALWLRRRDVVRAGGAGGVAGAVTSALGFSTGPCSVMGCGAPVLPVAGLAFTELTSGTLAFLATLSRVATTAVLLLLVAGVVYFGWREGRTTAAPVGAARGLIPESSSSPLRSGRPRPPAPGR